MPFCFSPWTNLDISPLGDIAPCCKYRVQDNERKFNIQVDSIDDYKNSDFLRSLKSQFESNNWPDGCVRCRVEEENNVLSKRQLDYQRWQEHYKKYDLDRATTITAALSFGNTCNLKCIMCTPSASSRWRDEALELFGKTVGHFKFYKNDFVQDFVKNAPDVIHLDIPGGEPFLSGVPEQKELLRHYVESGKAGEISLHYTTNVSVYPDSDWWELWAHFKEIDMQLSIDGVGPHYEYIRYPAIWDTTVNHTQLYLDQQQRLSNFRLSVSHTLSAYNIYYLDEFFTWCSDIGLPTPWVGKVYIPKYMQLEVWPQDAKAVIVDRLRTSTFLEVKTWAEFLANTDASQHFEEFKYWTNQHDQYRGLNFVNTFPELAQWVKN